MIELNIIKEQYIRMTDEELQLFAINEADKLTIESFHVLKDEFAKRNLDLNIIESAKTDRLLADLGKQSTFEKATAYEFANSLWQFALDQKELGKPNDEIYNLLLSKGVDEKYAFMLIQSLDTKSKELEENYNNEMIVGWIILFFGLLTIYFAFNEKVSGQFGLYGFLAIAGGGYRIYTSSQKKEKYQKVSKKIEQENNEINQN